jgi:hypothetical protein
VLLRMGKKIYLTQFMSEVAANPSLQWRTHTTLCLITSQKRETVSYHGNAEPVRTRYIRLAPRIIKIKRLRAIFCIWYESHSFTRRDSFMRSLLQVRQAETRTSG